MAVARLEPTGYARRKTGSPAFIHFGPAVEAVLRSLPTQGLMFPKVALMQEKHRAKEFKRRCVGLSDPQSEELVGDRLNWRALSVWGWRAAL